MNSTKTHHVPRSKSMPRKNKMRKITSYHLAHIVIARRYHRMVLIFQFIFYSILTSLNYQESYIFLGKNMGNDQSKHVDLTDTRKLNKKQQKAFLPLLVEYDNHIYVPKRIT